MNPGSPWASNAHRFAVEDLLQYFAPGTRAMNSPLPAARKRVQPVKCNEQASNASRPVLPARGAAARTEETK
jgi:hypothetical protein